MMEEQVNKQTDVWEKMWWLWTVVYYFVLILTNIIALGDMPDDKTVLAVALSVGVGLWPALIILLERHMGDVRERPIITVPLGLIIIGLWYALAQIHPIYYFVLMGLFPHISVYYPPSWAVAFSLLLTTLTVIGQSRTFDLSLTLSNPLLWLYLGMTAIGIFLGVWINAIIKQSTQRRLLIEQLEATQSELADAQRREGMLAERQRLARDIHDTLAQGFTSIVMHLEAAEQALSADLDTLQHHLQQARGTARHSLEQARRVVQDLRPELLEDQSLPDAIARTVQRWSQESQITAVATTTGTILPLHPDIEVTLLRAAQEALANVRKHAQAQNLSLTLSYMGDIVILDVQDDGVGMNGAAPSPYGGGFGLTAMRQRLAQLGGELLLESEPEGGTTLVVRIPVGGD